MLLIIWCCQKLEAFKVKLKASSKVLGMSYKPCVKFLIHHTNQGNANALAILRFMSNVALWYTMPKPQNNSNRLKEKHFSQEFFVCSLVLKLKVYNFRVFIGTYNTVYRAAHALFLNCTRYFFQHDTSSESNCNRSFWDQPSGWNQLIVVMCASTRVLP